MTQNFPILIEVEEQHVGKVLRILDATTGIVNLHLHLRQGQLPPSSRQRKADAIEGPPRKKQNRGRPPLDHAKAADIVGSALIHGAMHYKILAQILQRNNFSPSNVYKSIERLVKAKMVRRVAPGTYRLTDAGERRFSPDNQIKPHGEERARGQLKRLLLRWSAETISHKDLIIKIMENGYAKNNAYTVVPRLIKQGLLERVGDAYSITAKGRERLTALEHHAQTAPKALENMNG